MPEKMRKILKSILLSFLIASASGCGHPAAVNPPPKDVDKHVLSARFNKLDNKVDTIKASGKIWTEVLGKYRTGKYSFTLFYKAEDSVYLKAYTSLSPKLYELASEKGVTSLYVVKQMGVVKGKTPEFEASRDIETPLKPTNILSGVVPEKIEPADVNLSLDTENKRYIIDVYTTDTGLRRLSRKIFFDKNSLNPVKEVIFGKTGVAELEINRFGFKKFGKLMFPERISIFEIQKNRVLHFEFGKVKFNEFIRGSVFELELPEEVNVQELSAQSG